MKTSLKEEYKNYFTKRIIAKLLGKKDLTYFETFIFNRIKNTKSEPYSGYKYLDKEEMKKYEPLIYNDLPKIRVATSSTKLDNF